MTTRNKLHLLGIILIFISFACNKNSIYNKTYDIEDSAWHVDNIASFNFQVQDTLQPYDVLLHVRHTSKYRYKNLFLFIQTTSPEGYTVKDTFEVMLANDKGRWYGSGWGDVYENSVPYKRFVRFPKSGTYTIELQQAMRSRNLQHITDIGIEVKTAKQRGK